MRYFAMFLVLCSLGLSGREAAAEPEAKKPAAQGPRTLEEINIEGAIPVPQVLFITARDQRRFLDFEHRRYLKTSVVVGRETILPSRIALTGSRPTDARKESNP